MSRFDKIIERRGTNSIKWDTEFVKEDTSAMWIADMDFETAPQVTEELRKAVEEKVYGYKFLSEKYYQAVIDWLKRRHQYDVKKEWICYVPNVVVGLLFAIQAVAEAGDEILVPTPVYGPFFEVVDTAGCVLVESPMKNENGYYTMDLEDFESKITEKTKAVLLCNPHNPSGRVWSAEELKKLGDICVKHDIFLISDDIHCELTTRGHAHTFLPVLSEDIAKRTIVCTSPSKAFNMAGIHVANVIIQNEAVRTRFQNIAAKSRAADCNVFAEAALIGAYEKSEDWLDELNVYLEENIDYFVDWIQENIPKLTVCKPEGTYLVWVDFRNTDIPADKVQEYLLEKCKIAVNDGTFFGKDGAGFARFNLACPRAKITAALEHLKEVL